MNKAKVTVKEISGDPVFHAGLEFTPPARGTWTIAHTPMLIPESYEIFVCPEGCLRGVVLSAAEFHGMDRFSMITVKENDLYDGQMEELFIEGITDILNKMDTLPPCVMIYTSCVHHFTAIDLQLIFTELENRFPSIDFIENYMNCTMRKSKLHFEEMTAKQLYAPLKNIEKDGSFNIIGNYFALDQDCEIYRMLEDKEVHDICLCETYSEYKQLEKASYNIYTMPVAKECASDLEKRLHQQPIYMPYTWDMDEIDESLKQFSEICGVSLLDLKKYRRSAEKELSLLYKKIKDVPIQIDFSATPRPLGLACLLLEHGFCVEGVYCDAILPGEEKALNWLKENYPEFWIKATMDFRCRTWKKNRNDVLAIGQKAAYFSGTTHFVNMVANDGLYGYVGIRKLCQRMLDAFIYEKDTKKVLAVKAKGCLV